tara:strand:- start:124 stop:699 length:576 start_codon:yes stop_codon:yes gene_type:complete
MKNILFTLALLISFSSFSQINIEKPESWFDMNTSNSIAENLKRIQVDDQLVEEILNDSEIKQSVTLYFFTKYDINKYAGVSPTINATLLRNINEYSLEDLKSQGELMMTQFKSMGMEEVSLEGNDYVNLKSGKKALELKSTFKLPGRPEKVISTIYFYFISEDEKWYIQLAFSGLENDKCDDIFKAVMENL